MHRSPSGLHPQRNVTKGNHAEARSSNHGLRQSDRPLECISRTRRGSQRNGFRLLASRPNRRAGVCSSLSKQCAPREAGARLEPALDLGNRLADHRQQPRRKRHHRRAELGGDGRVRRRLPLSYEHKCDKHAQPLHIIRTQQGVREPC